MTAIAYPPRTAFVIPDDHPNRKAHEWLATRLDGLDWGSAARLKGWSAKEKWIHRQGELLLAKVAEQPRALQLGVLKACLERMVWHRQQAFSGGDLSEEDEDAPSEEELVSETDYYIGSILYDLACAMYGQKLPYSEDDICQILRLSRHECGHGSDVTPPFDMAIEYARANGISAGLFSALRDFINGLKGARSVQAQQLKCRGALLFVLDAQSTGTRKSCWSDRFRAGLLTLPAGEQAEWRRLVLSMTVNNLSVLPKVWRREASKFVQDLSPELVVQRLTTWWPDPKVSRIWPIQTGGSHLLKYFVWLLTVTAEMSEFEPKCADLIRRLSELDWKPRERAQKVVRAAASYEDNFQFTHDVFLSHNSKDKAVVRALADRLRADGLRVWLDDWEIPPRTTKALRAKKIEEGLEHSRALVLCMSAQAFSDWAHLEAHTIRFRDPLNKERRFIPLRLDKAPIRGSLRQLPIINWLPQDRENEYPKLRAACRPPGKPPVPAEAKAARGPVAEKAIRLESKEGYGYGSIEAFAFSPDGKRALATAEHWDSIERGVGLWDVETGRCLREPEGHTADVMSVAWSPDGRRALFGGYDWKVRLWDVGTGRRLRVLKGHEGFVYCVVWSCDQRRALSSSNDCTMRLWDLETGRCLRVIEVEEHTHFIVHCVAWSGDNRRALTGANDGTVRLWDVETGRCLRMIGGHTGTVESVAWGPDGRRALSGSADKTVRLWDVKSGRCLRVLEGHRGWVFSAALSPDGRHALSGSSDSTVLLWDVEAGTCLRLRGGHKCQVRCVAWSPDGRHAFSGDERGGIRVWDLSAFVAESGAP